MEKQQITLDIATYGWGGESWQGFYPEDLPEDWRLDFYSNEIRSVVVPVDIWQELDSDTVDEWQDAVHDEFRFYFETTDKLQPTSEQSALFESLGDLWGGWVCREAGEDKEAVPSIWYAGEAVPRQMREAIDMLHTNLGSKQRGVIVVSSTNEPWQVASDMRQLVELMGYG